MRWIFPHVFYDVAGGTGDFDVLPARLIVATVVVVGSACAGEHAIYLCVTLSFLEQDPAIEVPCVLVRRGRAGRTVFNAVLPVEIASFQFCLPPMIVAKRDANILSLAFHGYTSIIFFPSSFPIVGSARDYLLIKVRNFRLSNVCSIIGVIPFYSTKGRMSIGYRHDCHEMSANLHFLIWRSSRIVANGSKVLLAIHAQGVLAIAKHGFNFAVGDACLLHLVYHGTEFADTIFFGCVHPMAYALEFSADLSRFKAMLYGLALDLPTLLIRVFAEKVVDHGGAYAQFPGDLGLVHAMLAKFQHLFPALCIDALPARYEQRLGRGSDEFIDLEISGFLRDLRVCKAGFTKGCKSVAKMLLILLFEAVIVGLIPAFRAAILLLLGFGRDGQDFLASYSGDRLADGGNVGLVFRVAEEFIDGANGDLLVADGAGHVEHYLAVADDGVVKIDDILHDDTFLSFCRKLWRVAGSDWTNSPKTSHS